MSQEGTICVRPYHWENVDKASHYKTLQIRIYALDRNDNTHVLRVENYAQSFFLLLPLSYNCRPVNWTISLVNDLYESIKKSIGRDSDMLEPFIPNDCVLKETLYDVKLHNIGAGGVPEALQKFKNGDYKKFPMLKLRFKTMALMYRVRKLFNSPFDRGDGQELSFEVLESEIEPITKLLVERKIKHCSWISAHVIKIAPSHKISSVEHEYIINWQSIEEIDTKISETWETHPSIVGFDIEAYSDNHLMFPKEWVPDHDAVCISVTHAKDGAKKEDRTRYLIVYGDINKIPKGRFDNAIVLRAKTQGDLVDWMGKIINAHQANVILSYNGLVFDYKYLDGRLAVNDFNWPRLGMLVNEPTTVKSSRGWESAAYGINKDVIVHCPGRLNIDMYKIVKRDFKLSSYKLANVGLHFELGTKDDVSPEYMFKAYEQMKIAMKKLESLFPEKTLPFAPHIAFKIYVAMRDKDNELLHEIIKSIDQQVLPLFANAEFIERIVQCIDVAKAAGFNEDEYILACHNMTITGIYCIQDVELCFDLYEHFKLWVASNEISNIVCVNLIDLYSRGQQIRCLNKLYREANGRGIVLDMKPVRQIPFVGGKVIDPEVGLHENVLVLDFKSLYPLIMCAYNICYKTFVPEELWNQIPLDWCNVVIVNCDEALDPSLDTSEMDEEDVNQVKAKGKKFCDGKKGIYEFRFLKSEIYKGLLPILVANLVNERDIIVKHLKDSKLSKSHGRGLILDKQQLGLKISANSFFGFTGVLKNGKRPFRQGGVSITALGRKSIETVIDYLKDNYNARIIYGDTDSCMICLDDYIKAPEDCKYWMERLSNEITELFPRPMEMKPEYAASMLALMKKKYLMMPMMPPCDFRRDCDGKLLLGGQFFLEKNGKFKLESKGVMSARRDNCSWARDVFDHVAYAIMTKVKFIEIIAYIIDELKNLFDGNVDYENFIITRSLRDNYKSKSYFMKVFSDILTAEGTPAQPGERLPYIVYNNPGAKLVGQRMMLRDKYLANRDTVKIDYIYYVDKILLLPVDQLVAAGYKKEINYLYNIKIRKNKMSKYVGIDKPVEMAVKLMSCDRDIEEILHMVKKGMESYKDNYQIVDHQQVYTPITGEEVTMENIIDFYVNHGRSLTADDFNNYSTGPIFAPAPVSMANYQFTEDFF